MRTITLPLFLFLAFQKWRLKMMLKQTPLHAAHRALNSKLTDFGGWEMPLHYGSQVEEHH